MYMVGIYWHDDASVELYIHCEYFHKLKIIYTI